MPFTEPSGVRFQIAGGSESTERVWPALVEHLRSGVCELRDGLDQTRQAVVCRSSVERVSS